jgi:tetratricopeptide (TPR) repeat protein
MNKRCSLLNRFLFVFSILTILNLTTAYFANAFSSPYQTKISYLINQLYSNPHNGKIANTIGFYYYKMENYSEAVKYYKKAIELTPDYPFSYNNLGVIYLQTKQYEQAEEYFQKAIALDPFYIKAVCNLGVTYFKMNNYSEAKRWYKNALKIDPEYVNKRKNYFLNKNTQLAK